MMKSRWHLFFAPLFLSLLLSCGDDTLLMGSAFERQEIRLQGTIDQVKQTKVKNNVFADGDAMGVYVVDYTKEGQPGKLSATGNNASNVKFVFHTKENAWEGESPLYWKDKKTPADIYGYYPYRDEVSSVDHYSFGVRSNQHEVVENTELTGYEKSDFLWAKTTKVFATNDLINLEYCHILANVQVSLLMGEGFSPEEWGKLDKLVLLENQHLNANIDLAQGVAQVVDNDKTGEIITQSVKNDFYAVVVPQTVKAGQNLLSITIDGQSYPFQKEVDMTFLAGKSHRFTMVINKAMPKGDYEFHLLDEAITPWDCDLDVHKGSAKEFLIIHNEQGGHLDDQIMSQFKDPSSVTHVKLTGVMNQDDFGSLCHLMPNLEYINVKSIRIKDACSDFHQGFRGDDVIPVRGFWGLRSLRTVIFPDSLKIIGVDAFRSTTLTGGLKIPEGVTRIENGAFSCYQDGETEVIPCFYGELELPSTLKYIGDGAFNSCGFTGELRLPEGLEYIGGETFIRCRNFTGELRLPKSLKHVGWNSMSAMDGIGGQLVIPKGFTRIEALSFASNFSTVKIPEGVTSIGGEAFGHNLKGDVYLPSTLTILEEGAFSGTKIQHVNLHENIDVIGPRAFAYCDLHDTLVIPSKVVTIEEETFAGNRDLVSVVLPASLERIKDRAFANCYELSHIRCLAEVPPVIETEGCFSGVAKDNFTIEVPEKSVAAYREAPYWREFKRISAYRNFVCRPAKMKVLNAGCDRDFILNADGDWKLTHSPSWCHVSPTQGSKKTMMHITIDRMAHKVGNRKDSIVFQLADSEEHITHMNVSQFDYIHEEDEMVQLQTAQQGKGINIFIVGDGYDAEDIAAGIYLKDMRQEMEYFFGVEPYTTYRDYFNFYTAIARSEESGIGSLNTLRNVKFKTSYGDNSSENRIHGAAEEVVNYARATVPAIAAENVGKLTAIIVPNAGVYDGVTVMWENGTAVSYCPKSEEFYPNDARGLMQHEACGHGFGKLADEYVYHQAFIQRCSCLCCDHVDGLLHGQSLGWYANVSLNGSYQTNEWSQMIFDPRYSDKVDLFPGGYYHSWGVYRPEWNSCMNNNVPYFNAPSRMAIVKRIMDYAGENFSYEQFVAKDNDEMGGQRSGTAHRSAEASGPVMHGAHPVILKGSPSTK